jgi:hypothetical protein
LHGFDICPYLLIVGRARTGGYRSYRQKGQDSSESHGSILPGLCKRRNAACRTDLRRVKRYCVRLRTVL